MYLSTNALGQRDAVTGSILVPRGIDTTKAPIVGFAMGTQGPAFKCRPAKALEQGTAYDQPAISDSLKSGYAVAITDYEGYSKVTMPTYMTGQSMGPAVIDVVRAAQRFPAAKLSPTAKVIFQGYSQGGGASFWAAEKQPTYAPELNLVGAVGGGVPADLSAVAKMSEGNIGYGFQLFAAMGLDAAYPELHFDSYLNDQGRAQVAKAKGLCLVGLLVKGAFKKTATFVKSNPMETEPWKKRLAENNLGSAPPKVPLLQYHGRLDEIVPGAQADALHKTYCAAGVKLQFNKIIADHTVGIMSGNSAAHQWIVNRFNDAPAPSNC
jgi:pimeloyl-ACP methyl ester carboxylesterase